MKLKHLLIFLISTIPMIVFGQTYKTNAVNNNFTNYNKFNATKTKVGNTTLSETKVKELDTLISRKGDTIQLSTIVPMLVDSGDTYMTPAGVANYVTAHPSAGSAIGFATYDSLATDSAYFNTLTHQLRVRHSGWWFGFTPSDSSEIYIPSGGYGTELISDPAFSSTATWYEFGNALVDAGVLTITNADVNTYVVDSDAAITTNGVTYKVEYTIVSISTSSVTVSIAGDVGTVRSTPGTYSEELTATGSDYIYINPAVGTTCVIDNISLKEKL